VPAALDWIRGFSCAWAAFEKPEAVERLRAMLAGHLGEDGVRFESRAWIVTAT
jgi:hypothetical protein